MTREVISAIWEGTREMEELSAKIFSVVNWISNKSQSKVELFSTPFFLNKQLYLCKI